MYHHPFSAAIQWFISVVLASNSLEDVGYHERHSLWNERVIGQFAAQDRG